jgi:hypothetical protein
MYSLSLNVLDSLAVPNFIAPKHIYGPFGRPSCRFRTKAPEHSRATSRLRSNGRLRQFNRPVAIGTIAPVSVFSSTGGRRRQLPRHDGHRRFVRRRERRSRRSGPAQSSHSKAQSCQGGNIAMLQHRLPIQGQSCRSARSRALPLTRGAPGYSELVGASLR